MATTRSKYAPDMIPSLCRAIVAKEREIQENMEELRELSEQLRLVTGETAHRLLLTND